MTVEELMAALSEMDPKLMVFFLANGGYEEVNYVEVDGEGDVVLEG